MSKELVSVSLAVAYSLNRVIGRDGGMPWNQRADLQRFRAMTLEKPVIMGRKTWASLGRPLPGRTNIVISRSQLELPKGVLLFDSLGEAIDVAKGIAYDDGLGETFVIGGGEIYRQTLKSAALTYIYVTELNTEIQGDTTFPEIPQGWKPFVQSPWHARDDYNTNDYRYITYHRT